MEESASKDGVVDEFYSSTIKYLDVESSSIGFPELVVPAIVQLKKFLKNSKELNYNKRLKHLLDKIKENSEFISNKRKDVKFGLGDFKAVVDWEIEVRQMGTPLSNYYKKWLENEKKRALLSKQDEVDVDDFDLPVVKKREMQKKKSKNQLDSDEFDSDDNNDDNLESDEDIDDNLGSDEEDDDLGSEDNLENDEMMEVEGDSDSETSPKIKTKTSKSPLKANENDLMELKANPVEDIVKVLSLSDVEDDEQSGIEDDFESDSSEEE